jgi:F-type H+-transporting ATPase subunit b
MRRLIIAVALNCVPFLLLAQEGGEHAGVERDMTPWLWANFAILAGALIYLFKKYATPFLTDRGNGIRKDIADSEKVQAEANAKIAEINAKLANLDTEIAAMKAEYEREHAQETERLRARQQIELKRISDQAEQEIEATAKAARLGLQQHAAKLALELAEQKVKARMNPDVQKKLASDFVESLR